MPRRRRPFAACGVAERPPKRVPYRRPADAMSWAPSRHAAYVYVADDDRGVDIPRPEVR
ncbi:hypothetical protein [Actinoallomurus sp. NPDC052274]|uniref:hypothetical protein n=1 Tax=Actinoallomurus sp. NPDC052274 TaxID=3155420 RepID=UPI00342D80B1